MDKIIQYTFQYYGVDWIVTFTVFAGLFLLGDKKKTGFVVGIISTIFAFIFSFQIGSIANGITSIVLFWLYLRGYLKWVKQERSK